MTHQSRKEFLKKLAQGSVYAAPVVSTLLAPRSVNAQGQESQAMDMMGGPPHGPAAEPAGCTLVQASSRSLRAAASGS